MGKTEAAKVATPSADFIDIEVNRRSVAGDAAGNFRFQFIVLFVKFQQGFRVDTDLAVDDEFHACQADAFASRLAKLNANSGLPTFIITLTRALGMLSKATSVICTSNRPE